MFDKKWNRRIVGAFGAVFLLAGTAQADTVTATIAAGHPKTVLWAKVLAETFVPSLTQALKDAGHELKAREFYGGSLVKVTKELEALEAGTADVSVVSTMFTPKDTPLPTVSYVTPFSSEDPVLVTDTVNNLHKTVPGMLKTWENHDAHYVFGGYGAEDYVLATKFPVTTVADLKGHNISTAGQAMRWLDNTGATVIEGNITTYYTNIQSGLSEGAILPASAAAATKIYEVAPNITRVGLGAQYVGALAVSKTWFDGLPASAKPAVEKAVQEFRAAYAKELASRYEAAFTNITNAGGKVSVLPDEERKKWATMLPDLAGKWAADLDKAGEPGTEVLKAYMAALRAGGAKPLRDWGN